MPDNPLSGKVGLDVTDFKSGISELNRNIRVVESGFQAAASGLGDWSKSASGLELRIKALSGEIDLQKSKVAALAAEHARVAATQGEGSKAAQDLEIRLNKETATLGKMESELGQTETSLSEMGDASGEAAKETEKLGKEESETTGHTSKFASALEGLKGKLNASVTGLKDMVVNVAKVGAGLAVGLVAGAVGAVTGIGALLLKTAATSDELVETAEKIGITTTRLQELNYIAEQTGTGVDTMQGSMAKMTRSLEAAQKAGTPAADAFKQLGVSVTDSNGQLRDGTDIFFDAITALGGVANETERDVLAMQLFGKSAMELNPLINLGADGMKAMTDEAHNLGAVMGEETVWNMANLNDRIAGVKAGFMGLVGTMVGELMPVADQLITWITDEAIPWLQDNLPKAIQFLSNIWTTVLLPAIQAVWTWMSTVLIPFLQTVVFPWLQENIPKALQTLSNFWTNILQPAIQAVWTWMSTVLIPFLQNTVFPWLQENIPKALQTLSDFWTNTLQPAIKTVWNWMSTVLIPFLKTLFTWLSVTITSALQTLSNFWTITFLPAITTVWNFFTEHILPIFQAVIDIAKTLGEIVLTALAGFWKGTLLPALTDVWTFLNDHIFPIFKDIWSFIADNLSPKVEWLATKFSDLASTIMGGVRKALDWVLARLKDVQDFLDKFHLPAVLTENSPSPFEMVLRHVGSAMADLSKIALPALRMELASTGALAGGSGQPVINNSWTYVIQAANPLQTSGDLARQVRLLELMH
jgi:hypothetical protein